MEISDAEIVLLVLGLQYVIYFLRTEGEGVLILRFVTVRLDCIVTAACRLGAFSVRGCNMAKI